MQRYFSNKKIDDTFELSSDDFYHIKTVMRLKANDKIEVVYQKQTYLCCLENVNEVLKVRQLDIMDEGVQSIPELVLCIPLLKEAKMDLIIQKATELGVSKIIPIKLARSLIKLDENKLDKKLERWNKIAKEASEQSKRITIPEVTNLKSIDELEKIEALKLVCSTIAKENNLPFLLQSHHACDRILVVVGPEGGLTSEEEKRLINTGFNPVRLGNNIMRVETVPIFFLSVINYEYME